MDITLEKTVKQVQETLSQPVSQNPDVPKKKPNKVTAEVSQFLSWHISNNCLSMVHREQGVLLSPIYPVIDHVFKIQICLLLSEPSKHELFTQNEPLHIFVRMIDAPPTEVRGRFRLSVRQMLNDDQDHHPFPTCPKFVSEDVQYDQDPSSCRLVRVFEQLDKNQLQFEEGYQTFSYLFKSDQPETPRYPIIHNASIYDQDVLQHRFTTNLTIDCEMLFTIRAKYPELQVPDLVPSDTDPENEPLIGDENCDTLIYIHGPVKIHDINVHERMLPSCLVERKTDANIIEINNMSLAELMSILRFAYYKLSPPAISPEIDGIRAKSIELHLVEMANHCTNEMVIKKCYDTLIDVNSIVYHGNPVIIAAMLPSADRFSSNDWITAVRTKVQNIKRTIESQSKAYLKTLFTRNALPDLQAASCEATNSHGTITHSCTLTQQCSIDSDSMPNIDAIDFEQSSSDDDSIGDKNEDDYKNRPDIDFKPLTKTDPSIASGSKPVSHKTDTLSAPNSKPGTGIPDPWTPSVSKPVSHKSAPTSASGSKPETLIQDAWSAPGSKPPVSNKTDPTSASVSKPEPTTQDPWTPAVSKSVSHKSEPTSASGSKLETRIQDAWSAPGSKPPVSHKTDPTSASVSKPEPPTQDPWIPVVSKPEPPKQDPWTPAVSRPVSHKSAPTSASGSKPETRIQDALSAPGSKPPVSHQTDPTSASVSKPEPPTQDPWTPVVSKPEPPKQDPWTPIVSKPVSHKSEPTSASGPEPVSDNADPQSASGSRPQRPTNLDIVNLALPARSLPHLLPSSSNSMDTDSYGARSGSLYIEGGSSDERGSSAEMPQSDEVPLLSTTDEELMSTPEHLI